MRAKTERRTLSTVSMNDFHCYVLKLRMVRADMEKVAKKTRADVVLTPTILGGLVLIQTILGFSFDTNYFNLEELT